MVSRTTTGITGTRAARTGIRAASTGTRVVRTGTTGTRAEMTGIRVARTGTRVLSSLQTTAAVLRYSQARSSALSRSMMVLLLQADRIPLTGSWTLLSRTT